jgi:amidophosphoribosyltransferase
VDTPDKSDLIAAQMPVEEVRRFIEADSLGYLSLEGMLAASGLPADGSCVACWTGRYPTRISREAETQYAREHEPVPSD